MDDMDTNGRERLILHGAVVMGVGLVFGLAAVMGVVDEAFGGWCAAHLSVIMMGIWMLAMAAVYPAIVLGNNIGNLAFDKLYNKSPYLKRLLNPRNNNRGRGGAAPRPQ